MCRVRYACDLLLLLGVHHGVLDFILVAYCCHFLLGLISTVLARCGRSYFCSAVHKRALLLSVAGSSVHSSVRVPDQSVAVLAVLRGACLNVPQRFTNTSTCQNIPLFSVELLIRGFMRARCGRCCEALAHS